MSDDVVTFIDNDEGYRTWVYAYPSGFVINALRGPTGGEPILHTAMCDYIAPRAGDRWTSGDYVKICCVTRIALDLWAHDKYGSFPRPCTLCEP